MCFRGYLPRKHKQKKVDSIFVGPLDEIVTARTCLHHGGKIGVVFQRLKGGII